MNDVRDAQPVHTGKHALLLYVVAAVLGSALLGLPRAVMPAVGVLLGLAASFTVAHFAWNRAHRVQYAARRDGGSARGRIVESVEDGRVVIDLPGDGLEPWALDSWVIAVTAIACGVLGAGFGWPLPLVFLAVLCAVVATRLRAAARDYLRIEVDPKGFTVESEEGGRRIRRFGQGALLPELGSDGLTLWSPLGRIGVLRWELTAAERIWLADRLGSLAEAQSSAAAAELRDKVEQGQASEDGKGEKRQHAD